MKERTEVIIICGVLILICVLAYGISTMADTTNYSDITYNGDPEGWNWNMNQQINGTLPIQNTSLTIYQEVIEPVESITVNGTHIHDINLDSYHVDTQLNGVNVSVFDVLSGVYGPVVIETSEHRYDVVVQGDDIVLVVK